MDIKETVKSVLRDPVAVAYKTTAVFEKVAQFRAKHPDKDIALLNSESTQLAYNKSVRGFEVNPKWITAEEKAAMGLSPDGRYMDLIIASRPIEKLLEERVAVEYIRSLQTNEPFRGSVVSSVLSRQEYQNLLDTIDDADDFDRLGIQFPEIATFDESRRGIETFEE